MFGPIGAIPQYLSPFRVTSPETLHDVCLRILLPNDPRPACKIGQERDDEVHLLGHFGKPQDTMGVANEAERSSLVGARRFGEPRDVNQLSGLDPRPETRAGDMFGKHLRMDSGRVFDFIDRQFKVGLTPD